MKALAIDCALFLVLAIVCTYGLGAPAPAPRVVDTTVERLSRGDLLGEWEHMWLGGKWNMLLNKDGTCIEQSTGSDMYWAGTWYIDSNGNLIVSEQNYTALGEAGDTVCTWKAVWFRDKRGRIDKTSLAGYVLQGDKTEYNKHATFSMRRHK